LVKSTTATSAANQHANLSVAVHLCTTQETIQHALAGTADIQILLIMVVIYTISPYCDRKCLDVTTGFSMHRSVSSKVLCYARYYKLNSGNINDAVKEQTVPVSGNSV